jgi:hypothetical protein
MKKPLLSANFELKNNLSLLFFMRLVIGISVPLILIVRKVIFIVLCAGAIFTKIRVQGKYYKNF